jgi:hypothetical protein
MKTVKTWIITKLARQVEGDYFFFNVEKATNKLSKVEEYLKENPISATEIIQSPTGGVPCMCERGIIEIDLDLYEEGE